VNDFNDLVDEAERVPIGGWDFGWLDGRAVEDRPTWRYFDRVAERAADTSTMLEVQAGVGSMIGALPSLPRLSAATEGSRRALLSLRHGSDRGACTSSSPRRRAQHCRSPTAPSSS
jgi:hypothetical protein